MGSTSPTVSVIVPVRNQRNYLVELLDGLRRQTYTDFETIVVDDGSSDGSPDAVRQAAEAGLPVRLMKSPGTGAVDARLAAVAEARGEVFAFTDSDCVPDPAWLSEGVAAIRRGADLVQGRVEPTGPVGPLERSIWVTREDGLYPTCNVLYRRDAYERAGGFDRAAGARLRFRAGGHAKRLGFGEDVLLGWRVRSQGRTAFAPDALVRHQVLRPTFSEALGRAWVAGAFPALVQELPGLRFTLLRHNIFLGHPSRSLLVLVAIGALLRRPSLAGGALAVWTTLCLRVWRSSAGGPQRLAALPAQLALDFVTEAGLIVGSVRARTPVL